MYWREMPMPLGMRPPPSAPISPIIEPATAVANGQRSGTSWNRAPLPAPRAAKHTRNSSMVTGSDFSARPHSTMLAAVMASTPVRVFTPPQWSDSQPPNTRRAAPRNAAIIVSWPAATLLTPNWS